MVLKYPHGFNGEYISTHGALQKLWCCYAETSPVPDSELGRGPGVRGSDSPDSGGQAGWGTKQECWISPKNWWKSSCQLFSPPQPDISDRRAFWSVLRTVLMSSRPPLSWRLSRQTRRSPSWQSGVKRKPGEGVVFITLPFVFVSPFSSTNMEVSKEWAPGWRLFLVTDRQWWIPIH